ncbi:MAG TPA: hypothetical protein PKK10_07140 [Woeseiaceae bacterium]|nr:hypothetical protein [Woeseiaceae bacterium]
MRGLTLSEIDCVTGGAGSCTPENSGADVPNSFLGGLTAKQVGDALIATYEGVVAATSHVIERVFNAF